MFKNRNGGILTQIAVGRVESSLHPALLPLSLFAVQQDKGNGGRAKVRYEMPCRLLLPADQPHRKQPAHGLPPC